MQHVESSADISTLEKLRGQVGKEAVVTEWVLVSQERIDQFAQATGDFQWIHVDVARAAKESPFGGTIAHGFLTLSLLGKFYDDDIILPFCDVGVNYGLNKVRFTLTCTSLPVPHIRHIRQPVPASASRWTHHTTPSSTSTGAA